MSGLAPSGGVAGAQEPLLLEQLELALLVALASGPEWQPLGSLARAVASSRAGVSPVLYALHARGYAEPSHPNGYSRRHWSITAHGREALERVEPPHREEGRCS